MKTQAQTTPKNLIPQITADQLDDILDANTHTVLDVRTPEAIEKQGAIPGAINLPFDQVEAALQDHHQEPDSIFQSGKPLLFCCTGGVMSYAAAIKAQQYGVNDLNNLEGGHAAWARLKREQAA